MLIWEFRHWQQSLLDNAINQSANLIIYKVHVVTKVFVLKSIKLRNDVSLQFKKVELTKFFPLSICFSVSSLHDIDTFIFSILP